MRATICESLATGEYYVALPSGAKALLVSGRHYGTRRECETWIRDRERKDRNNANRRARHAAYTSCGMTRTHYE